MKLQPRAQSAAASSGVQLLKSDATLYIAYLTRLVYFFQEFGSLLVQSSSSGIGLSASGSTAVLDPASALGLFMRKCRLLVNRMPFELLAQLYLEVHKALDSALASGYDASSSLTLMLDSAMHLVAPG